MAARKKKATKKKATKKKAVKRAPVQKAAAKDKPEAAAEEKPEATAEPKPVEHVVTSEPVKTAPPPPPQTPDNSPQSKVTDETPDRLWRILVQVDNALYRRVKAIAERENALFPTDEELSIAQQAAVLLEGGVTMWEEDERVDEVVCHDNLLEDPDYAEALMAAMSGRMSVR